VAARSVRYALATMWQSLPEFGTVVLYAILVAAGYTFSVALAAGSGRPRLLQAARLGAYGTIALVGLAVFTLAYAFVSHDFRLSYVARYSDRGMTVPYQIVALWGGQDGSLLWWLFLISLFSGICVRWLGRRYLELQPYVIATLMSVVGFYAIIMVFAVNPFATNLGGAPVDGQGLNYQLRNFYMIIHPPALYVGFTSAAVPCAFAVAALVTGRLDSEWIHATRKWMLFSWLFLSIGNVLGMLWAYEELGWGGHWAWDPVENAACLPWWTASAYVHSTMIQERRGMLKVWNVFLILATFWLTIFGTFLTRSGLIASVHAFAKSSIGPYFVAYMGLVAAVGAGLVVWRLPKLRSEGSLESPLSREGAFVANNWALLGVAVFIAIATSWPIFSEHILKYSSTVGPTFYNFWLPIPLVVLVALMAVAPLLGWKKTSPELFKKSFLWPTATAVVVVALHAVLAGKLRMPPFVEVPNLYTRPADSSLAAMSALSKLSSLAVHYVGAGVAWLNGKLPAIVVFVSAFNVAVVSQEFGRGVVARQRTVTQRGASESVWASLAELVAKSRRRYGGYIVHLGVVGILLGFTGRAWTTDREATLEVGQSLAIDEVYSVTYHGTRRDSDPEKMAILADVTVFARGKEVGRLVPAKFIYKSMGGQASTEIARHITPRDDLYVTLAMANPQTKAATFQFHVNPLVSLILVGAALMVLGALVSLWPDVREQESRSFGYVRLGAGFATTLLFAGALVLWPGSIPRAATIEAAERAWLDAVPGASLASPSSP